MKEKVLLYGVCAAISIVAVAITSITKLIVCAIAKKCGKDISGNAKEYLFTPMAIILAALGLYIWLEVGLHIESNEQFILTIICFSVGTMLIYLLLFQPTRKLAVSIIRVFAKSAQIEPVVDAVKDVLAEVGIDSDSQKETCLQSNALTKDESTSDEEESSQPYEKTAEAAADKLRSMVEGIKQN